MVHRVLLGKRHQVIVAVDGRRGAKQERPDVHLPGKLQHRLRPGDIEMRTPYRILDRGPHARLGGQVHDRVNRLPGQHAAQEARVVDVLLVEMKILPRAQVSDALLFDGAVVVGIEVVDGRHRVAIVQQAAAEMPANEAGGSGDEDVHHTNYVG